MCSKTYNFEGIVGNFRELIIQFVQFKKSVGFNYDTNADNLKRFSKFSLNYSIKNLALTKEIVDAWTAKRPAESQITWEKRIDIIRQFAKFLNGLGYEAHVPVCKARLNRNLYVPHIFSAEQLRLFFTECKNIRHHPLSNKHLVLPAIYRVLYGCGLRISEAIALKTKDVDLNHGIITIRASKLDKDRLIPMSESLTLYLRKYFSKNHSVTTPGIHFFSKRDKTAIASNTVYKHFRKILWKSGISHGGKGKGPRLHDFRHTFAVHSLNQMVRNNIDLYCALPILSTYLGHASTTATERYLRLTAEVYPEILSTVSKTSAYVFPEVKEI